jgi:hypothetical protein
MYGPQIPPSKGKSTQDKPSPSTIAPIGPVMPSTKVEKAQSEVVSKPAPIAPQEPQDSSSDDDFGPQPMHAGLTAEVPRTDKDD